jgi:hypothetical protein
MLYQSPNARTHARNQEALRAPRWSEQTAARARVEEALDVDHPPGNRIHPISVVLVEVAAEPLKLEPLVAHYLRDVVFTTAFRGPFRRAFVVPCDERAQPLACLEVRCDGFGDEHLPLTKLTLSTAACGETHVCVHCVEFGGA